MRFRWWLLAVVMASACTSSTTPTVPFNKAFTLAPGEIVVIDETSIGVRFVNVLGDSRCPANANCIQAGDAIVWIEVNPLHGPANYYALHTATQRPIVFEGQTISLVQVTPYPSSVGAIKPEEYRVTLRITR